MTHNKSLICLAILGLGCNQPNTIPAVQHNPGRWTSISVRNRDFKVISTISSPDALFAFSRIWDTRKKVHPSIQPGIQYKIDIQSGTDSGRWLYDPAGFVQKLDMARKPIYQIESNIEFNRILGINE